MRNKHKNIQFGQENLRRIIRKSQYGVRKVSTEAGQSQ